MNVIPDMRRVH